ncbi:response regulator [Lacibacterium aquatile]|uniref:histidine kinase n=1 Tax=Lacibacterium aquatile TaxID=1168082 RepID=A0ABW5DQY6_9PROT
MTDLRAQLLAAFDIEHREHLEAIRAVLALAAKDASVDFKDAFRRAHSLKGAARAVDLPAVEDVANRLEAILARLSEGTLAVDPPLLKGLHLGLDAVERYVADLAGSPLIAPGVTETLDLLAQGLAAPNPQTPPVQASASPAPAVAYLRVATEQVEDLLRQMHDWNSDLLGVEAVGAGFVSIDRQVRALRRDWDRLAVKPRAADGRGADALRDFDRQLKDLFRGLGALSRDYRRAAWVLGNTSRRLQKGVAEIALVPVSSVYGEFGRMVRDMARDQGVDVAVITEGFDLQVDRQVLQKLKDPTLHLLRNAVGHGGEAAEVRRAKGKPAELTITLAFASKGGRLEVMVRDDGPGPDLARIQTTAVERGLLPAPTRSAPRLSADQLLSIVFAPGFSTAIAVDRLSGRGMGLSVVAEAVRALHGSVILRAGTPFGAEAVVSVPLQASRQTILSVDAGGLTYAIPTHGVERLLRLPVSAIENADGRSAVRIQIAGNDVMVPIMGMASLLGAANAAVPVEGDTIKAVLLRRGERRCALAVDGFHDVHQALIGEAHAVGIDRDIVSGAIIEGGEPALVLDPDALVRRWMRSDAGRMAGSLGLLPRQEADELAPTVLVVDDSITTRTLQKSILEAQGYRVLLSVDGAEALQLLRSGTVMIDLVVADVEMPRMDGFSLLQAVKNDAGLATIPFILMTSRESPEDVRRGLDLGADAYLTKQKFDQRDLLATIGRLL